MKIKAPAKINLTLDITGKREDGYHTIESVMQTVSLYDEIEINPNESGDIHLFTNKNYLPVNENNTAYRAAVHFYTHTGIKGGVDILIQKRIPGRAGMGGGSADAAAVLKAMNELYKAGLSKEELTEIGAKVGADVPFCILGGTCTCTGIGETCRRVEGMPDCTIVICKPPAGMSTPRAYALVDQYPMTEKRATQKMEAALQGGNIRAVANAVANRFDEVMRLNPVRQIKRVMLGAGALNAMMTGSGSAVYGIFTDEKRAHACADRLRERGKVYIVHPLNA